MEYNPSSEYIAIFGDIQYYTNAQYISLFQYSCDWILAQKHAGMNVNSVLLVGDVTQHNNDGLWGYFQNATKELVQEIPFISAIGDHDYTWGEDGYTITDRNNTEFSKYLGFPLTKQKVVLFPDNDFAVVAVDSNKDQLKDFFLFPFINKDQGSIVDWMNKEKQKALAHEVGLNIVESKSIEVKDGNFSIPSVINYPCFTKTRAYIQGTKKTLKRCNNEIELRDFLRDLGTKFDLTLLVEDYKEIDKEYAIVGFSDGNRVVIPDIIQLLNIAHGSHFGVACRGKVMPIDGFEKIVTKFKQFILKIGWRLLLL